MISNDIRRIAFKMFVSVMKGEAIFTGPMHNWRGQERLIKAEGRPWQNVWGWGQAVRNDLKDLLLISLLFGTEELLLYMVRQAMKINMRLK